MTDQELNSGTGIVEDTTVDYISAINELKQNTVDRAQYDKLRSENKKLLESIVNGREIDIPTPEPKESIQDLRNRLFKTNVDLDNLEYISTALELREQLITNGEPDPFLPIGSQISPTEFDVQAANKVATVLQECVDIADGNNGIFTNELQRRLVETKIRK